MINETGSQNGPSKLCHNHSRLPGFQFLQSLDVGASGGQWFWAEVPGAAQAIARGPNSWSLTCDIAFCPHTTILNSLEQWGFTVSTTVISAIGLFFIFTI